MVIDHSERKKGILALLLLSAVYGGVGIVTRYLNVYFPILVQIYLRLLIAVLIGFVLFRGKLRFEKLSQISAKEWFLILIRTLASFVLAAPLWVAGANTAKLANVGFIDSLPLTAAFSLALGLEKFTLKKGLYILLSFAGVVILSVRDFSDLSSFGYGEFLVLVSGFFFAFRNFSRVWHSKLLNDQEITMIMFVFGFIMVFVASVFTGDKVTVPYIDGTLALMLLLGGFIMIANIFFSNYGFLRLSPVLGNNILNLEAVFAIIFGFLFFREMINIKEFVGGLLIILSVIKINQLK